MFAFGKKAGCRRVRGMLSEYVDDRLGQDDRDALEKHIRTCEACSAELESLRMAVELLQSLPHVPAPRSFAVREAETRKAGVFAPQGLGRLRPAIAVASVAALDPRQLAWLRPATVLVTVALLVLVMVDVFQVVPREGVLDRGEMFYSPPQTVMAPAPEDETSYSDVTDKQPPEVDTAPEPGDDLGSGEGAMVGDSDSLPAAPGGGGWPLLQIEIALGVVVFALLGATLYLTWRRARWRAV